jgi:hypothetical protein
MVSSPSRAHPHLPFLTPQAVPSHSRMDEVKRLQAVSVTTYRDPPPDGAYDRITALAARLFKVPIAIVSIVEQIGYGLSPTIAIKYSREGGTVTVACTRVAFQASSSLCQGRRYRYRSHSNQKVGRNDGRDNRRREYRWGRKYIPDRIDVSRCTW